MDGQTSAAGPASSCDALGPRLNSPGPNLETKPGSAVCAGSTCIRVLADLSVYCLRKSMHSNLQCATFLQCLLNTHTTAAIGSNACFFSSTTFSGGRHIFGFFSHSYRVSGITWPTVIYLYLSNLIYIYLI